MRIVSSALLLFLPLSLFAADKVKVSDLLKAGVKHDLKDVTVRGTVEKFTARTSKSGNPYFLFRLMDGKQFVSVYGKGKLNPEPKDGDRVEVTGEFARERKSGTRTFKNEIDATPGKKLGYGVKIQKR